MKYPATNIVCENCKSFMKIKKGQRGLFLICSAYPKCRRTAVLPDALKASIKEKGG